MSTTRRSWIVVHDGTGEIPNCMECKRCGRVEVIPLPVAVDKFLKISREFQKKHGGCQEAQI